jgi:hypothetical protein
MNLANDMQCLNCKTTLKAGGTQICVPEIIHYRTCENCDLEYIIFKPHPKREYSLYSEPKGGI